MLDEEPDRLALVARERESRIDLVEHCCGQDIECEDFCILVGSTYRLLASLGPEFEHTFSLTQRLPPNQLVVLLRECNASHLPMPLPLLVIRRR